MNFQNITLQEICPTISYDFKVCYKNQLRSVDILIVSFKGKYRNGSEGHPDAGFISGIINTGVSVFDPWGVLIDLSELEYNWGDNLDLSFAATGETNTAVLVGDTCRKAMSTLRFGLNTKKDIVDNVDFFDSLEEALKKLKEDYELL